MTRTRRLLSLLALVLGVGLGVHTDIMSVGIASAQRTWPSDAAGRPAPPCTVYDPVTNTTSFCSTTAPLPVSGASATTGAGSPAGSSNDPLGYGRSLFETTAGFNTRTGVGGSAFRWQDATSLLALTRTAATTIQVWVSNNRGQSWTNTMTTTGGVANQGTMRGSLLRNNGLYIASTFGTGVNGPAVIRSSDLATWIAATGTGVILGPGGNFATTSLSVSPNTANRIIGVRGDNGAAQCQTILSTDNGASWANTGSVQACGGSQLGVVSYVGGTTWLWVVPGSGAARRSTDDGSTWSAVTTPVATILDGGQMCVAPTSGLGYCLVSSIQGGTTRQIYRSTDAGTTWTQVLSALNATIPIPLSFTNFGANLLGVITDFATPNIFLLRSDDAGLSWSVSASAPYTGGGTPTAYFQGTCTNNLTCGSPSNGVGAAVFMPDGAATPQNPLYGAALGPGALIPTGASTGIPWSIDRAGRGITSQQQSATLNNTQVTGAATTAVVTTLAATSGERWTLRRVEARCNTAAATASVTIESPVGTTIWSTLAVEVIAASRFLASWVPGLTALTNTALRITLSACTAGTGTLTLQADRAPAP